ncbi:MAG: hypothetical protein WCK47_08705 [bacterium]|nr:hypothetical protein [Candidatus Sumerlaeota bacterium]
MITITGADHIRTSRQIKSFRGVVNATGAPMQVADLGRVMLAEAMMMTRKLRFRWLKDCRMSYLILNSRQSAPRSHDKGAAK